MDITWENARSLSLIVTSTNTWNYYYCYTRLLRPVQYLLLLHCSLVFATQADTTSEKSTALERALTRIESEVGWWPWLSYSSDMNPESVLRAGKLFQTSYGGDGVDFIDQLNYQYTGGLMVIFIAIIGVRQYVGKPPVLLWTPFLDLHFDWFFNRSVKCPFLCQHDLK